MLTKMLKIVGVTMLIAGLVVFNVAVGQATEAAPAGYSPERAIAPTVGWSTVEPGTSHWYTFNYDYDDSSDDPAPRAIAMLEMDTPGSVGFVVQTMERLGPWYNEDEDPGAVGIGSPMFVGKNDDGDVVRDAGTLVWAGSANASGNYLIIVEGDGAYHLTVNGETVNFTRPSLDGAMAFAGMEPANGMVDEMSQLAMGSESGMEDGEIQTETFGLTIEPAAAAVANAAGMSQGYAVAPTIGWATVEPGQSHWYTFNYDYDNDSDDAATQAIAKLEMETPGSVGFVVQTAYRLGPWFDVDEDPGAVGNGMPAFVGKNDDGDVVRDASTLVWAGSSGASERYYIIVEGDGAYRLSISGEDVYFPETIDALPAFAMTSK